MARLQNCFIGGVLVLTVTVLLNTRPAEAGNCASADDCKNGGTCPATTSPCVCGSTGYKGDTCADACDASADCGTGGTCNTGTTPKTCTCGTGYSGVFCGDAPACTDDATCVHGGTCNKTAAPYKCTCATGYSGDTCANACKVDDDCLNGGKCDTSGTNNVCTCGDYKGDMCADECDGNADCGTDGTCGTTSPKKCTCKDTTKEGPGCTKDKSGASAVTSFSLMSLCVILTGYLL